MKENYIISKLHNVFEGNFQPGILKKNNAGRYSAAFVYLLYGEIEYVFEDFSHTVKENELQLFTKGSIYEIRIKKPSAYICIDFDFSEDLQPTKNCVFSNLPQTTKNVFTKALSLWLQQSSWTQAEIIGLLYQLYSVCLKSANKSYTKSGKTYSKIIEHFHKNYTNIDFSVEQAAKDIEISEVHIRRILKAKLNLSPIKYLNYLRMEKAKNMLQASNYSIDEISYSSGFSDPYYFSRVFKKEIGMSPVEFRRKYYMNNV